MRRCKWRNPACNLAQEGYEGVPQKGWAPARAEPSARAIRYWGANAARNAYGTGGEVGTAQIQRTGPSLRKPVSPLRCPSRMRRSPPLQTVADGQAQAATLSEAEDACISQPFPRLFAKPVIQKGHTGARRKSPHPESDPTRKSKSMRNPGWHAGPDQLEKSPKS